MKKNKPQRAIITIADDGRDRIDVKITFDPEVDGTKPNRSQAIQTSMEFMSWIVEKARKQRLERETEE